MEKFLKSQIIAVGSIHLQRWVDTPPSFSAPYVETICFTQKT